MKNLNNSRIPDESISKNPIARLFQHSAIYSLSTSVQRLQGLIMTPIYTSAIYLPEMSEYGNYGLIYTFIAFMNFVYLYGMDSAFLRYFFLGKSDRKTVFSTTFFTLLISGLVTSLLLIIFANPVSRFILFSPELGEFIRLAALILFIDSLGNLPYLILRSEERPVSFTVFRMMRFVIELLLNILFVVLLRKGVHGILYANILAAFINLVIMLPYTGRYLSMKFDRSLLTEMVRFGLPFLPNGIAFMTIEMVDRFLVTDFLGKEVVAFYHANYKFATILLLLIIGFRNAWQPFFLKISKEKDAPIIYARVLNYYLLAAAIVVVFVTLFIRDLLTIRYFDAFYLLDPRYWTGIIFIPMIILSYYFYGVYVIFTPAFYIKKKSSYMIIFTGTGAALNIILNFWLLPAIGIWGAVVATVAAYAVMMVSIILFAQKIYPIPVRILNFLWLFLIIGLVYLCYYIIDLNIWLRMILFLLFLAVSWNIVLSFPEKATIKEKITNLVKIK
ncbi:MAG: oligosaccharide flippase family protein [Calditrichaeota bacterium]|nr:oligosaccharide flippase family protein [Calditrichota bacterium]